MRPWKKAVSVAILSLVIGGCGGSGGAGSKTTTTPDSTPAADSPAASNAMPEHDPDTPQGAGNVRRAERD